MRLEATVDSRRAEGGLCSPPQRLSPLVGGMKPCRHRHRKHCLAVLPVTLNRRPVVRTCGTQLRSIAPLRNEIYQNLGE